MYPIHLQNYIAAKSRCGNCSTWRALAADTWGATYRGFTETTDIVNDSNMNATNRVIDKIDLLNVSFYWYKCTKLKNVFSPWSVQSELWVFGMLTRKYFFYAQVGIWRPIDAVRFEDVLFPHIHHGFRGKELPIITYHVRIQINNFELKWDIEMR